MELRREDFPVTLQAYDMRDNKEDFVAEQVVSNQAQADNFMSMYAGRLIKTRELRPVEAQKFGVKKKTGISPLAIFLFILVVLIIVGFATGWIQEMITKIK